MRLAALLFVIPLIFTTATARTWYINPDGTGDAPTIQAGIDSAVAGDIIELADGTFRGDGNRDLDYGGRSVTVRSQSGTAEMCVIDPEGTDTQPHRAFEFRSGETTDAVLSGVRITGGWWDIAPYGGGILINYESSPTIRECEFIQNVGSAVLCSVDCEPLFIDCAFIMNEGTGGGGVWGRWASPTFEGCVFMENTAGSGGAFHGDGCSAVFRDCDFVANSAASAGAVMILASHGFEFYDCYFKDNSGEHTGAIYQLIGVLVLDGCAFVGNRAEGWGGALTTGKSTTDTIRSCTFVDNEGPCGTLCLGEWEYTVDNTIVAFGRGGPGLATDYTITLTCCDIYGNEGGDWVGSIADQYGINGNLSSDPLFCDLELDDFTLRSDSPCLPGNHPDGADCGLIGAFGEGCGSTSTEHTSWSGVKALFR
ncbi:MAG: right-handed parallel beta-helix repeat-containing protein [Candidatus Eisenbacteria bacterium]